jgi:hypothetical protein
MYGSYLKYSKYGAFTLILPFGQRKIENPLASSTVSRDRHIALYETCQSGEGRGLQTCLSNYVNPIRRRNRWLRQHYIIKSFIFCILRQLLLGYSNQGGKKGSGEAYRMVWREGKCMVEKPEGRSPLGRLRQRQGESIKINL